MTVVSKRKLMDSIDNVTRRTRTAAQPLFELWHGARTRTLPWEVCAAIFVMFSLFLTFRMDVWLFHKVHLLQLYPRHHYIYWLYYGFLTGCGFLLWAALQTGRRRLLIRKLTEAFECASLKNRAGKLPGFIYDIPLDAYTRKLKISNAKMPLSEFKKAKEYIESGLQVHVDDIREERNRGAIEITYSHEPMPDVYRLESVQGLGPLRFVIGNTRSRRLTTSFSDVPHLLIAGQTGGGKSTFLRQLITTLYVNDKHLDCTLIDLKEGLEFQLFENLERATVLSNLSETTVKLKTFVELLERRLKLLKVNKVKDLSAYLKLPADKRIAEEGHTGKMSLNRHLIVIDEAADLFLAGSQAPSTDIQKARRALIEIARKGRAAGMHLVFATQRPDSKAIDSQIKTNLPGVVCFQMPNDQSSILVLGNGRATDLPPVPGRAIWKASSDMIEVQTPLMTPEEADELLKPFRVDSSISQSGASKAENITIAAQSESAKSNDAYARS